MEGYIKGTLVTQDTFNRRRVRKTYEYKYYIHAPSSTYQVGPDTVGIYIARYQDYPYSWLNSGDIELRIDTTKPTALQGLVRAEFRIIQSERQGNILYYYQRGFESDDGNDTLIVQALSLSRDFLRVSGRFLCVRRDVTPHDTVTVEFESPIPREIR
jgi:hypothetical protein